MSDTLSDALTSDVCLRARLDEFVNGESAFSEAKDVAVARAWISVSDDAIFGAEQRSHVNFLGGQYLYLTKFIPT